MNLRNKKTDEIVECAVIPITDGYVNEYKVFEKGDSLAELNEEWEDYEEKLEYWCITGRGNLHYLQDMTDENDMDHKAIGNYFETKEEAEKAVEKLKAWKRMKDKGFRFQEWYRPDGCSPFIVIETNIAYDVYNKELQADLDLLFGGEE